jgi:hypothetical protein
VCGGEGGGGGGMACVIAWLAMSQGGCMYASECVSMPLVYGVCEYVQKEGGLRGQRGRNNAYTMGTMHAGTDTLQGACDQ